MSTWQGAKKFYRDARAGEEEGGFVILLDDRPIRTPAGKSMAVGSEELARAIAEEWADQDETLDVETMPLTRLTATAIDRVEAKREEMHEVMRAFAGTDLLCYRAEEPPELVQRQTDRWQPLVDWAATILDAPLTVTTGVIPVNQPDAAIRALSAVVEGYDHFQLVAVSSATAAAGSVVIGVALEAGRITAEEAGDLALLDEEFQMELWGQDAEALARHRRIRADIEAAARFLALLGGSRA